MNQLETYIASTPLQPSGLWYWKVYSGVMGKTSETVIAQGFASSQALARQMAEKAKGGQKADIIHLRRQQDNIACMSETELRRNIARIQSDYAVKFATLETRKTTAKQRASKMMSKRKNEAVIKRISRVSLNLASKHLRQYDTLHRQLIDDCRPYEYALAARRKQKRKAA